MIIHCDPIISKGLTPEYATTSITIDPSSQQPNFESSSPYLPPPIEPIRPQIFNDSFMDTSDCPAFYYSHPNTIPNIQDPSNFNFWRFNGGQSMANNSKGLNLSSQMSFNDFSKDLRKTDQQSPHDNFHISSIYSGRIYLVHFVMGFSRVPKHVNVNGV